jgi:hypothetical protein
MTEHHQHRDVTQKVRPAPRRATVLLRAIARSLRGVRCLAALVLLLAVALGWMVHRVRVQREAVAAIEAAGGHVVYDFDWPRNSPIPLGGGPRWPQWLVARLGRDYFGSVVSVEFTRSGSSPALDDEVMAHVGRLSRLRRIFITSANAVTDVGIARLGGLRRLEGLVLLGTKARGPGLIGVSRCARLRGLSLGDMPVTDSDLAHLSNLKEVLNIDIKDGRSITDEGLKHLEALVHLLDLEIRHGSRITGAGLSNLRGMTQLRRLALDRSRVESLVNLPPLPGLESLDLTATPIEDEGLAPVASYGKLKVLLLRDTRIGDGALSHMGQLPELWALDLSATRVTDAGLGSLSGSPGLGVLALDRTRVTDAGLAHAGLWPSLTELSLNVTAVGDAGLAHLKKVPGLARLYIDGTHVTDRGLVHLAGLGRLDGLSVGWDDVTDTGLGPIASLPCLVALSLRGTDVTDEGLARLAGLKRLALLDLSDTRASIGRLRQALPNLKAGAGFGTETSSWADDRD